jgi:hypothetical protein
MSFSTNYAIATQNSQIPGGGSDAVWAFAQRVNSDIATNLNNVTATTVPMDGAMITSGTGWAINGNGIQLTGPRSFVRCSYVIHVREAFARGNLLTSLALNGTLFGPVCAHGYIRNANGHQESSYCMPGTWVGMQSGDIITIQTIREANAGNITMATAGTSQLLLERLVNV